MLVQPVRISRKNFWIPRRLRRLPTCGLPLELCRLAVLLSAPASLFSRPISFRLGFDEQDYISSLHLFSSKSALQLPKLPSVTPDVSPGKGISAARKVLMLAPKVTERDSSRSGQSPCEGVPLALCLSFRVQIVWTFPINLIST